MNADKFNSLGGFSVNIPPVTVVDSSGNVVTNVNAPTGNVTANVVYANAYRQANGAPVVSSAGGSNTELQFNNNGSLAGIETATYSGNVLSLGSVANISISGGDNGYVLSTDGLGNLSWTAQTGGEGQEGTPGGSNSQIQINEQGLFGAVPGFTFNKDTNILSVPGDVNITGTFSGNGHGIMNVLSSDTVVNPVQANITQVGTLSNITVTGLTDLGSLSNIKISGGNIGQIITTDGTGNLSWSSGTGGSNTQIQYNKNGTLAGSEFLTYNENTSTVQVGGNLIANVFQTGSGGYKFSTSSVMFATTASTAKTVLFSIPVAECSGVDFEIIGTDSTDQTRQSLKISSVYYAGTVQYNEYAGLYINGGVGTFAVEYNPGDLMNDPSLNLVVTPDSINSTVYKMLITVKAP